MGASIDIASFIISQTHELARSCSIARCAGCSFVNDAGKENAVFDVAFFSLAYILIYHIFVLNTVVFPTNLVVDLADPLPALFSRGNSDFVSSYKNCLPGFPGDSVHIFTVNEKKQGML